MTKKIEKQHQLNNLLREVGTINVSVELPVRNWFYVHQKLVAGIQASNSRPKEVIELILSLGEMLESKGVMLKSDIEKMYKETNINKE